MIRTPTPTTTTRPTTTKTTTTTFLGCDSIEINLVELDSGSKQKKIFISFFFQKIYSTRLISIESQPKKIVVVVVVVIGFVIVVVHVVVVFIPDVDPRKIHLKFG